jgi:AcrR family transcriptional regulator
MPEKASTRRGPREPQQDRSRTSLRRLLETAEPMLERDGYGKFTLQALSKRAKVSIGSIYHMFDGKQDLIRELQVRFLDRVEQEHALVINQLRREGMPLRRLVPTAVRNYGEHLRRISGLLRVFMEVATTDAVVSTNGKKYADQAKRDFELLLLDRREEIRHPDPEHAVSASYMVMYAVFGRRLGFGTTPEAQDDQDWEKLVADVSLMIQNFLLADPADVRRLR